MPDRIKTIIFDMDGVLIDAKDWHYEALNQALNHFGYDISRYDHVVTFDGLPTRKKLEMLSRERGLPVELHTFLNQLKQQYTMEMVHTRCKPRFEHEYALSRLKADGFQLAVASNSVHRSVEVMMERSGLLSYLDFFVSNEDVKNSKPDPEIYLVTMSKLGVSPDRCLVLEDNENGIQAARAAGAHVMVVESVTDVTYHNIIAHLQRLQELA